MIPKHRRVAWLSPLPPQPSGIANYSEVLLQALRPRFDFVLFTGAPPPTEITNNFEVHALGKFEARRDQFDEIVYHVGNNIEFHSEIYQLAWRIPGTVVIHDYNLNSFLHDAFYRQGEAGLYYEALIEGFGSAGQRAVSELNHGIFPDAVKFPLVHVLAKRSKKVIVHHRWVKGQLESVSTAYVIPHFARLNFQPTPAEIDRFRLKYGVNGCHFVISCLGFINQNKLPELQIKVATRLLEDGYPLKLIFAGEPAANVAGVMAEIRNSKYHNDIISTGYLEEKDYFCAIAASDVIVNLRNPSIGEASGTLMHSLAAAKPTIVSALNQYLEFPDSVCWKLDHDGNEEELLYAYLAELLSRPELRAQLSSNAAKFVETALSWEKILNRWTEVLSA